LLLSVDLRPEFREAHGVVPHAAAPERLDPFFDSFSLFHVVTSPGHGLFSPYRPRFGVLTGKLIGSVQYFLSVFTFLAFSFMVVSP